MQGDDRTRTKLARLAEDLVEKLGEIIEVRGDTTVAAYLDPLVRAQIERDHLANKPAIAVLRSARARAAKLRDEAPAMASDLGGEG